MHGIEDGDARTAELVARRHRQKLSPGSRRSSRNSFARTGLRNVLDGEAGQFGCSNAEGRAGH